MSGKRAKKVRKLNGGQRPRANRRGGSGRRLTQEIIDHLKKSLDGDLEKSAEKFVEQHGIPQLDSKYLEVLPGIPVRAYIPSLGRMGSDDDVDTVLNKVRRENSHVMKPRKEKDRTGERPYAAAGCTQFFHGQLRSDVFLALRWGQQEALPSPNALLDEICIRATDALRAKYPGLHINVVALHMPNPYMEKVRRDQGWNNGKQVRKGENPEPGDKIGGWNVHLQVYTDRVDPITHTYTTEETLFTFASDATISSMQLGELGVDVDEHRESRFAEKREREYRAWIDAGCKPGKGRKALNPALVRLIEKDEISTGDAIKKAVATDLLRKEQSWAKADEKAAKDGKQHAHNLKEKISMQVAGKADAPDLWLSDWFTKELAAGLRQLHPRYGELLDMAPTVFCDLKKEQIAVGHKVEMNDLLNRWEEAQAGERRRLREAAIETSMREAEERADKAEALNEQMKADLDASAAKLAEAGSVIEALKLAGDQHARDHQALLVEHTALKQKLDAAVVGSEEAAKLKAELQATSVRLSESEKEAENIKHRTEELQLQSEDLKSKLQGAEARARSVVASSFGPALAGWLRHAGAYKGITGFVKGEIPPPPLVSALIKTPGLIEQLLDTPYATHATALKGLIAFRDHTVKKIPGAFPDKAAVIAACKATEKVYGVAEEIPVPPRPAKVDESTLIEKGKEIARAELARKIEELQTQICDRDIHIEELERVSTTVATDHLEAIVKGFAWMRENPGKPLPDDFTMYFEQDAGVRLNSVWQRVVEAAYRSEVADTASRTYAERIFACQEAELASQFLLSKEDSIASAVALVRSGRVDELSPLQKSYFDGGFGLRDEVVTAAKVRLGQMQKQLLDERGEVQLRLLKGVVEFASMPIAERAALFVPELSHTQR